MPKDERSAASAIDEDKLTPVGAVSMAAHRGRPVVRRDRWPVRPAAGCPSPGSWSSRRSHGSIGSPSANLSWLRPAVIQVVALGVVTFGLGAAFVAAAWTRCTRCSTLAAAP